MRRDAGRPDVASSRTLIATRRPPLAAPRSHPGVETGNKKNKLCRNFLAARGICSGIALREQQTSRREKQLIAAHLSGFCPRLWISMWLGGLARRRQSDSSLSNWR
jgi:hypothetical protein